ncbi:MAG TPA: hypothetical protein VEB64_05330 [Azospirillaceae bacterium]|nr:hypothetical protein [Azospirillaceae bacterium]
MSGLTPIPFAVLVTRMFRELEAKNAIFDLPARRFVLGDAKHDLSVTLHGKRASTPFGPAAGPHTQLAQNIVLAWLAGGRVIELKTVQVRDDLEIPRPCIDMATVGFNVEWSQELTLDQSLEEYVKAAMLIEMLKASGRLALAPGFGDTVYDMSVGYDLDGIRSDKVQRFIDGLKDASTVIEKLRGEIPDAFAAFRGLPYPSRISDTLTLSTFHGCPPQEIEGIADTLMRVNGLNVVVKLNPTLLGKDELNRLLHDEMGYTELEVPDAAFAKDAKWEQAVAFADRLGRTAENLGLSFGVKFSNTLLVRNHKDFFPASEKEMYLSGAPLHVLAMALVRRFRQTFGDRFPISFSAGIDAHNFADAVALGLVPVTVCSDLLKPGGYGRAQQYFKDLGRRMDAVGAATIGTFIQRAFGHETGAILANTETYAEKAAQDPYYRRAENATPPRRVGSHLALFDCLTCDKCVPVCPNDANFTIDLGKETVPVVTLRRHDGGWVAHETGRVTIAKPHQIANLADACNECGNCDIFCPEEGGPYKVKPTFFLDADLWRRHVGRDGVLVDGTTVLGRFDGREYRVELDGGMARYAGPGFDIRFNPVDPAGSAEGMAEEAVDLTWFLILERLRRGVLAPQTVNFISMAQVSG